MKFTRSLPAKAMARAKVPISTTTFSTFTPSACSSCISSVNPTRHPVIIRAVWPAIQALTSGVMNVRSLVPLISRKYMMAVAQMPP